MTQSQPDDVRAQLRDALLEILISKVRADQYPSATMMNMVDRGIDLKRLPEYAQVLMDKIEGSQYPSPDMMRRLTNLL